MGKHPDSVDQHVLRRIVAKGKGWVFTPSDFQDLGSRTAVDLALMRHRRLAWSWMDYPTLRQGTLCLVPLESQMADWRRDYQAMTGSQRHLPWGQPPN